MYTIQGDNPTKMYFQTLSDLFDQGDRVAPRGKLIREMRPACLEFTNPYNRVTFLRGRRINPFFQIAESLWILSGRADVEWLEKFNKNIAQFSDDGKWFNAPYGERMRTWNKNALRGFILNPVDQLIDVYTKIITDPDTRQAVIVLSNPMFDNSSYTINEHGKDIACNLCLTFKVRQNKLHMTVFNRSNDIHWGVFGANLCQFSTIQEVLFSWLKYSGYPRFENLEMGTYNHITDSLHVYLDDYGSKITDEVLAQYQTESARDTLDAPFIFDTEPRMTLKGADFDEFLFIFWSNISPVLMNDQMIMDEQQREAIFGFGKSSLLSDLLQRGKIDEYWEFAIRAMLAYRLVKLDQIEMALEIMHGISNCQWKVSMLHFLKPFIRKLKSVEDGNTRYQNALDQYTNIVKDLGEALPFGLKRLMTLTDYLKLYDEGDNSYKESKKPADVV